MSYTVANRLEVISPIEIISQAEVNGPAEALRERIKSAAKDGFFYLEMPPQCQEYLVAACDFANNFYNNAQLKTMQLPGWSGYRTEENSQREHFFLERLLWEKIYPEGVQKLAILCSELCHKLLSEIFIAYNIPENLWEQVSGGVTTREGQEHFSFNHYRSEVPKIGLKVHRDFGILTALYINSDGLKARIRNNEWVKIAPREGYLLINFGRALETIINCPEEFCAAWHGVDQLTNDRISFGLFVDPKNSASLYKMQDGIPVMVKESYSAYVQECFADVYSK